MWGMGCQFMWENIWDFITQAEAQTRQASFPSGCCFAVPLTECESLGAARQPLGAFPSGSKAQGTSLPASPTRLPLGVPAPCLGVFPLLLWECLNRCKCPPIPSKHVIGQCSRCVCLTQCSELTCSTELWLGCPGWLSLTPTLARDPIALPPDRSVPAGMG